MSRSISRVLLWFTAIDDGTLRVAYDVATIYRTLGDSQNALDWLERALERR